MYCFNISVNNCTACLISSESDRENQLQVLYIMILCLIFKWFLRNVSSCNILTPYCKFFYVTAKETQFFTRRNRKDAYLPLPFHEYLYHFNPLVQKLSKCLDEICKKLVTGESTPSNMWFNGPFELKLRTMKGYQTPYSYTIPEMIKDLAPNVKIIAIFRNPTER